MPRKKKQENYMSESDFDPVEEEEDMDEASEEEQEVEEVDEQDQEDQDNEPDDVVKISTRKRKAEKVDIEEEPLEEFESNPIFIEFTELLRQALEHECIRSCPIPAPLSKGGTRGKGKSKTNSSSIPKKGGIALDLENIACPITGCTKSFTTFPGILYHLEHFEHPMELLFRSTRELPTEIVDLHNRLKSLVKEIPTEIFPVQIPIQRYSIKGKLRDSFLVISIDSPQIAVNNTKRISKKIFRTKTGKVTKFFPSSSVGWELETSKDINYVQQGMKHYVKIGKEAWLKSSQKSDLNFSIQSGKKKIVESKIAAYTATHDKQTETFIANPGISVWAMDWVRCKGNAVGGYSDGVSEHHYVNVKQTTNLTGCIQIWRLCSEKLDIAITITHEFGCVFDLSWCPNEDVSSTKKHLGFLGVTFGNGSFHIMSIPWPSSHEDTLHCNHKINLVKWKESVFQTNIANTLLYKLAWNSKNQVVLGCTNGFVAVWNVDNVLRGKGPADSPDLYEPIQSETILCIDWYEANDDKYIITGSVDGEISALNVRDPFHPIIINRFLGVCSSLKVCRDLLLANSTDFKVFAFDLSFLNKPKVPSATTFSFNSVIWSIDCSPFFDFALSCSADGELFIFNLQGMQQRKSTKSILFYKTMAGLDEKDISFCLDCKTGRSLTDKKSFCLSNPLLAIQILKWNPNFKHRLLFTSGGAGWFRIDNAAKS